MTKEEKDLLLKDLSARLPYGVKVMGKNMYISNIDAIHNLKFCILVHLTEVDKTLWIEDIKPYLRPMDSMTEGEKEDYNSKFEGRDFSWEIYYGSTDWLNAHHLDYRGLIPMGLALEAPADMYV